MPDVHEQLLFPKLAVEAFGRTDRGTEQAACFMAGAVWGLAYAVLSQATLQREAYQQHDLADLLGQLYSQSPEAMALRLCQEVAMAGGPVLDLRQDPNRAGGPLAQLWLLDGRVLPHELVAAWRTILVRLTTEGAGSQAPAERDRAVPAAAAPWSGVTASWEDGDTVAVETGDGAGNVHLAGTNHVWCRADAGGRVLQLQWWSPEPVPPEGTRVTTEYRDGMLHYPHYPARGA